MSRQRKACKLKEKEDRLTELPEEVLNSIIYKLTFKEAVKTSSLSKAWQSVWTCYPNLLFDTRILSRDLIYSHRLPDPQPYLLKLFMRHKFVEQVDRIMNQRVMGPNIDSLTIRYNLGQRYALEISRWIQYAVLKGVKEMDFDFSNRYDFIVDKTYMSTDERYPFCCTLLASSEGESTVKDLHLNCCSISTVSWPNSLNSVVKVVLWDVKISDVQVKNFLLMCPSLENFTLGMCNHLVNLEVAVFGRRIKDLRIVDCFRLKTINISAEYLPLFCYKGRTVKFFFKSVPRLTTMELSFTRFGEEEGVAYALSRLAKDVPKLASLNMYSVTPLKNRMFAHNAQPFSNIQKMSLFLPFNDDDEFVWVSNILQAFPKLHKLTLHIFAGHSTGSPRRRHLPLPEAPHMCLTTLIIDGFEGYSYQVKLLEYLIANAHELKVLWLKQSGKVSKVVGRPIKYRKIGMGILEWINKNVSPLVDVHIQSME